MIKQKNDSFLSIKLMLALAMALGINRFIFTPAIPVMESSKLLTPIYASLIASFNYIGYFVGSVFLMIASKYISNRLYHIALFLLIITCILMIFPQSLEFWLGLRFISGLCSAFIFIFVAKLSFENAKDINPGLVYGGVGLGIFFTGVYTLFIDDNWQIIWIIGAILSAILSCIIWNVKNINESTIPQSTKKSANIDPNIDSNKIYQILFKILTVTYFLEAVGYIVMATFIVALIKQINPIAAKYSWLLVGISATPSTLIWNYFAKRYNVYFVLFIAFILQSISVIISIFSNLTFSLCLSSIIFGFTFMGITMLTFIVVNNLQFNYPVNNSAAKLTVIFSIGQIVGPILVSPFIRTSYIPSFFFSLFVIILATILVLLIYQIMNRIGLKKSII